MNIEERLEQLEDAHRALAAQHAALMAICRVTLPLISCDPSVIRRLLLVAYDGTTRRMEELGHDAEHQEEVRHWLDELSSDILSSEYTLLRQQNSDANGKQCG